MSNSCPSRSIHICYIKPATNKTTQSQCMCLAKGSDKGFNSYIIFEMYASKNYIEKPINLLCFDSLGHAILNQQAISYIESIPKPISILSIAGPYRTGKSYLLNSMISGDSSFQVSATTSSCTKGLWVWGKPLLSVDEKGKITNVLIIDSQGFGSCHSTHDKRIIILALLLSTCFIYNSKGMIDKDSMRDLQYVIEETKKVKRQICFDSVTDFHWILRDFHYQLVNELGLEITPGQYMQKCFKQYSDQSIDQKQTFKLLSHFFRNRSCHTFVAPETDPSLEQSPQFQEQLIKFKKILSGIPSLDLDGEMLSSIIDAYVSAMNENLTATGVYQEGNQCRIRLNCLTQLCRELQAISEEEQIQKRGKLIKAALHEVQDSFISKMKSEKQIKILKEQINMLISQFDQNTPVPTVKIIKNKQKERQPRNSVYLRTRDTRISMQPQQEFISERQIKNTNKMEMITAQKIREQLEAKIHRCQLQIKDLTQQIKSANAQNRSILEQKLHFEEKYSELNDAIIQRQKGYLLQRMDLEESAQKIKKENMKICSQLTKQNELLKQKTQYLQQRITQFQIQSIESASDLMAKYKDQISYLERENREMVSKHMKDIQQFKQIYKQFNLSERANENSNQDLSRSRAISQQFKSYIEQVSKLQEQNQRLIINNTQLQNKYLELQHEFSLFRTNAKDQSQLLNKNIKETEKQLAQIHGSQLQAKQKLVKELQCRIDELKNQNNEQIQLLAKNNDKQSIQTTQMIQNYEQQIRFLKQQCVQACEKLQIEQNIRIDKQKQIKMLVEELYNQKQNQTKSNGEHYETINQLRTKIQDLRRQVQKARKQNEQLRQLSQQMRKQVVASNQQHQFHIQQRKKLHQIQINRLQQKIQLLTHSNLNLKKIKNQYQLLQTTYNNLELEKDQLLKNIERCHQNITKVDDQNFLLKQENGKLSKIISDLTNKMANNQLQLQEFSDRNNQKLQLKQNKYLQLTEKLHEKEKQCYFLTEQSEIRQKEKQLRQKELKKLFNDKLEQKTTQINNLKKANEGYKYKMDEMQIQVNNLKKQLSLSQQKCTFVEQSYLNQLNDAKDRSNRENQRHSMEVKQFELQLQKLTEQKTNLSKTLTMYENNTRQTCNNITEMRSRYDKNCQQYQSNMKLMRKRIFQLESQNKFIKGQLQKTAKQLTIVQKCKDLLQQNYNQDFKLWASKVHTFQSNIRRMTN